ncbi:hypothetical protein D0T11_02110 [Hymenobacter rubripertinctus]|uniref:Uncharacterized protein n=1 Tax=Hymenobacter rubripertinctus TaxID=2029981 RepID=A0A418R8T2_9BACT|nr:hypothetical protein D0T11_02110 [Hymenobacter rubripertinctus]
MSSDHPASKTKVLALNSTILYLLAYLLVQGAYQAATVGMARRLSIPGIWGVSGIHFTIADPQWWRIGVLAVYGAGPAVCALLGLGAVLWFWFGARQQPGLLKLWLLWVVLHACNLVLGALAADTLLENWAWYLPSWLFLAGNIPNIALAVVAALLQVVVGYFAAIGFLQSHDSITLMQFDNRPQLIRAGLWAPWLLGSLALAVLKLPDLTQNELLHFLTMALLLLPLALHSRRELFDQTLPRSRKSYPAWELAALTLLVAGAWWWVLTPGLRF